MKKKLYILIEKIASNIVAYIQKIMDTDRHEDFKGEVEEMINFLLEILEQDDPQKMNFNDYYIEYYGYKLSIETDIMYDKAVIKTFVLERDKQIFNHFVKNDVTTNSINVKCDSNGHVEYSLNGSAKYQSYEGFQDLLTQKYLKNLEAVLP
jgi:hypothetical protein